MTKPIYQRLKELNRKGLRHLIFKDHYVINVWVFRSALALSVLLLMATAASTGGDLADHIYFYCPEEGPVCPNPFYSGEGSLYPGPPCPDPFLCPIKEFAPGESYGTEPFFLMKNFGFIILLIWAAAFAVNHYQFNGEGKK